MSDDEWSYDEEAMEQSRKEREADDRFVWQTARKILYGGCPLCVEDTDMCRLCFDWKIEKSKKPGDRWATFDPEDHKPMSPIEEMSAGRVQFLKLTGEIPLSDDDIPPRGFAASNFKQKKVAGESTKKHEPKPRKPKACATWKDKKAAKFTGKETKQSTKKGWKGSFTSQGYPHESSEWEPAELRFVYRPPGYGPERGSKEAKSTLHCPCCHLRPCIGTAMREEIQEACCKHLKDGNKTMAFTRKAVEKLMMKEHCRLFMKRYLLKYPVLDCIRKEAETSVDDYLEEMSGQDMVVLSVEGSQTNADCGNSSGMDDSETEEEEWDDDKSDDGSLLGDVGSIGFVSLSTSANKEKDHPSPLVKSCCVPPKRIIPNFNTPLTLDSSDDESDQELFKPVFPLSQPKAICKTKPNRVSIGGSLAEKECYCCGDDVGRESSDEEFEFTMS